MSHLVKDLAAIFKSSNKKKKGAKVANPVLKCVTVAYFKSIPRHNSPAGPAQNQPGIISQVGLTLTIRAGERELLVPYSILMSFVHQPRECLLRDGLHRRSYSHPGLHLQDGRRQYRVTGLRRVDFGSLLDRSPSSNSRNYPEQCRRNVFTEFDSAKRHLFRVRRILDKATLRPPLRNWFASRLGVFGFMTNCVGVA